MIFNVNFIIHLIFVLIMCLGFNSLNSAGILLMIKQIVKKKDITEVLVCIAASIWIINVILSLILYRKCFKIHTVIQYTKLIKKDPKLQVVIAE